MDLRVLAGQVNGILDGYISVHDEFFGRSVLNMFKNINFDDYYARLILVLQDLHDVREYLLSNLDSGSTGSSAMDSYVTGLANEYLPALQQTILKLASICENLADKGRGIKYSMIQYREDIAEYNRRVARYVQLGSKMNTLLETADK